MVKADVGVVKPDTGIVKVDVEWSKLTSSTFYVTCTFNSRGNKFLASSSL